MNCDPWREAISARADGEPTAVESRLLDAHLAGCPSCQSYAENVHVLRRAAAVELSTPLPDLSGHVVKAAKVADRGSVWWVLRLGLGVVASQIVVLSVPALLLGHSAGSDKHAARHLGSFAVAYAIGLLVVALRPAKARGMLPLAAALAVCLAITGVIDIIEGHVPAVAEVHHIPEVVGLVLMWALAMPQRVPGQPPARRLPALHSVDGGTEAQRRTS